MELEQNCHCKLGVVENPNKLGGKVWQFLGLLKVDQGFHKSHFKQRLIKPNIVAFAVVLLNMGAYIYMGLSGWPSFSINQTLHYKERFVQINQHYHQAAPNIKGNVSLRKCFGRIIKRGKCVKFIFTLSAEWWMIEAFDKYNDI